MPHLNLSYRMIYSKKVCQSASFSEQVMTCYRIWKQPVCTIFACKPVFSGCFDLIWTCIQNLSLHTGTPIIAHMAGWKECTMETWQPITKPWEDSFSFKNIASWRSRDMPCCISAMLVQSYRESHNIKFFVSELDSPGKIKWCPTFSMGNLWHSKVLNIVGHPLWKLSKCQTFSMENLRHLESSSTKAIFTRGIKFQHLKPLANPKI